MDSNPDLGYDISDGPTKNKNGGFNYNSKKLQWGNNFDQDPKKIFSITEKAIDFINKSFEDKKPFLHSNISLCNTF